MKFETADEERQRLSDLAGRQLLDRVERRLRSQTCDEANWPPADFELDEHYYRAWEALILLRAEGALP